MARVHPRQAYTLIEIMLVLALMIVAAAMTVPMVQTMLIDSRITASGDIVRARAADTRAKALEDGRPWKLAFMPGTGVYQLAPEDSTSWNGADRTTVRQADLIRDELPTDIVFAVSDGDIVSGTTGSGSGKAWETIGVFLPDGSARDDLTTYFGYRGIRPMRIVIRGLTGAASIEVPVSTNGGQP